MFSLANEAHQLLERLRKRLDIPSRAEVLALVARVEALSLTLTEVESSQGADLAQLSALQVATKPDDSAKLPPAEPPPAKAAPVATNDFGAPPQIRSASSRIKAAGSRINATAAPGILFPTKTKTKTES